MNLVDEILGVKPSPQREARNAAGKIPLAENPEPHRRKPTRRLFHNTLKEKAAIQALRELPAAGETHHYLMAGAYDAFDLIPAILARIAPETIAGLHIATLGFNHANATRLIAMLDAGQVAYATMLTSVYYEADHKEAETCYKLAKELPARHGWYLATRCHAKVIAMETTGGPCYILELLANLRSCRNIEQFTITNDRDLFQWHRKWMREVYEAESKRKAQEQE